jgi:hypothetical protein
VISARGFVLIWTATTLAILVYAFVDLWVSPSLHGEHSFSMQVDFSQIWEVRHWGGRLVRERAWSLLAGNAVAIGGILALAFHGIARFVARRRLREEDAPPSLVPDSRSSVPPYG